MDSKVAESMSLGGGPTKEVLPPAEATAAEREKILGTKKSLWDNAVEKGIVVMPYKLDGDKDAERKAFMEQLPEEKKKFFLPVSLHTAAITHATAWDLAEAEGKEEEEKCPHGTDHAEAAGLSKFLRFYKEECLPLLGKSTGDWKKVPELVEEASQGSLHRSMCKNEPYSGYHVDTILAVHELCGIHSSLKPTDSCHRDADWKPKGPTYDTTYKKACIALEYARSLLGKWLAKFDENAW
jgi:hypothetical protein